MENSKISWCDHTHNLWWGCTFDSVECHNCYAMELSSRFRPKDGWGPHARRSPMTESYWRQPLKWNRQAEANNTRQRVFCASMSDVFERLPASHPDAEMMHNARKRLWDLISETPWLDWQLLTKRPQNMNAMLPTEWVEHGLPANIWAMTSVGNEGGKRRIADLFKVKARVRGLSVEPMIEGFSLQDMFEHFLVRPTGYGDEPGTLKAIVSEGTPLIHWVILGGESGRKARPFDISWPVQIIGECRAAGVAPFLKQLGAVPMMSEAAWRTLAPAPMLKAANHDRVPADRVPIRLNDAHGGDWDEWPTWLPRVREFPATAIPIHQKA